MTDSKTATNVLREYANAIRYDWSCIDGRGVRDELEIIADTIDGGGDVDIRSLRLSVGICPKGFGKWQGEAPECDECDERGECL